MRGLSAAQLNRSVTSIRPQYTASPSIVKLLALILRRRSAITDSLAVQS